MQAINELIFRVLFGLTHANGIVDLLVIFLGTYLPYLLLAGWLWFMLSRFRGWRLRFLFVIETALAVILSRGILTEAIRFFFPVARPFAALGLEPLFFETNNAFPSSHAAIFFAIAVVVGYFDRRMGLWFFALAIINGIARVAGGVHWPLDILGGFVVAVLGAAFAHKIIRSFFEELGAPPPVFGKNAPPACGSEEEGPPPFCI